MKKYEIVPLKRYEKNFLDFSEKQISQFLNFLFTLGKLQIALSFLNGRGKNGRIIRKIFTFIYLSSEDKSSRSIPEIIKTGKYGLYALLATRTGEDGKVKNKILHYNQQYIRSFFMPIFYHLQKEFFLKFFTKIYQKNNDKFDELKEKFPELKNRKNECIRLQKVMEAAKIRDEQYLIREKLEKLLMPFLDEFKKNNPDSSINGWEEFAQMAIENTA